MYPTLQQCKNLSKAYNRIPVYKQLNISHPGLLLLLKSFITNGDCIFLESAKQNKKQSRFSFLGFNPVCTISFSPPYLIIGDSSNKAIHCSDPFKFIDEYVARYRSPSFTRFGSYNGGLTGYFSYDLVNYTGHLRQRIHEDTLHPLMVLHHIDDFICYDNKLNTYYIATCIYTDRGTIESNYNDAQQRLHKYEEDIINALHVTSLPYLPAYTDQLPLQFAISPEQFMKNVLMAKTLIEDGEALQIVLSMRAYITEPVDPYRFYLKLRQVNPSPYMFFMKHGNLTIAGSSPEIHVKVEHNTATLRPIAGTIAQGKTRKENIKNKQLLLENEKERAEHLMLVDLARNDLGIIAHPGSVKVTQFMQPEDYSHVIHLVSNVTATLDSGISLSDVLRHSFPAGTVSGAPKVRAIEIIDQLEPHPRGIYAGCVGYIGFNNTMDTCITIRTAVFSPQCSFLQAGAGIVYDSIPQNEYNEIVHKLKALSVSLPFAKINSSLKEIV
ncbi:MAG: chorismate-binding protein [Spirochaetes bacterium]|nr:chorismate-binding protein [Spirochaetota bacterium]